MIGLSFTIDNISTVLTAYNHIQIAKYTGTESDQPPGPTDDVDNWVTMSGSAEFPIPIALSANQSFYQAYDNDGEYNDWYSSRYIWMTTESGVSTIDTANGWSSPILGETGDLYYDPEFPKEVNYGTADQRIIDRIRIYTGDPLSLRREYGEEAMASIHPDGKTYELSESGWPVFITMGGKAFNDTLNPSVNGYRYLKFQEYIDEMCSTCSGITSVCGEEIIKETVHGVDIWYYSFRESDRQIMNAYETCPVPSQLTETTATPSVYMIQTAIDLLRKELIEDSTESGAKIRDEGSSYDPSEGLKIRKALLDDLKKRLDEMIKTLMMQSISGVLID